MPARRWTNEAELADLILARARAGKGVTLEPDTAYFVGLKLQKVAEKPTHAAIVKVICGSLKCEAPCTACTAKANVIVDAYGFSLPPAAK